ncbi:MAG: hypothetical protein RLZZ241_2516 [Bacteroidota bacterium]|jgi:glutamyl-tRNA synthetase
MERNVRVRFAPSPTGPLHIGGVRTALYNYLFAKKHAGVFILRIEDTDQNRFVPGAEEYIIDSLNWLNLPFDEGPGKDAAFGPYRQSERKALYEEYALELIRKGWAYYAFDKPEDLENRRKIEEEQDKTFIYNWHNRDTLDNALTCSADAVELRILQGEPYVIRFKWPKDEILEFQDIIRGPIKIDTNTLDDKVLFKSDGMPTYHLANVVDDHLMQISHVIRGEEWLPSLALHVQMYRAFGWVSPEFAHLPLIMKPTGKGKLSKRDGEKMGFPVFPLQWNESIGYKEAGYFPEAVVNFLALLGWNPGTEEEIFTLQQLIELFDLERVQKSGARFDPEKNKWYNHKHLINKNLDDIAVRFKRVLEEAGITTDYTDSEILRIVDLLKERCNFVAEMMELGMYFFTAPTQYDQKAVQKQWKLETPSILSDLASNLKALENFEGPQLETYVKQWIESNGYKFGQVMPPLRLVLVGSLQGPHLFDIMEIIGKKETINRINAGVSGILMS